MIERQIGVVDARLGAGNEANGLLSLLLLVLLGLVALLLGLVVPVGGEGGCWCTLLLLTPSLSKLEYPYPLPTPFCTRHSHPPRLPSPCSWS